MIRSKSMDGDGTGAVQAHVVSCHVMTAGSANMMTVRQ